jgi:hypothetical protein
MDPKGGTNWSEQVLKGFLDNLNIMAGFFKKNIIKDKSKDLVRFRDARAILEKDAAVLPLEDDEELIGVVPAYIGVRDNFDTTHSYPCSSARERIEGWKLGGLITTSKHFIFRKMNADKTLFTAFEIPIERIQGIEVSGVNEKQLELLTNVGSFEFKFGNNDQLYAFREVLEQLSKKRKVKL